MVADSRGASCPGTRRDGSSCRATPQLTGWCFRHDPDREADRREASAKGGKNKSNVVRVRQLVPDRLIGTFDMLEKALGEVHDGSLDPKAASAMAGLAGAMVRVLSAGELEERLRKLEGSATIGTGERIITPKRATL